MKDLLFGAAYYDEYMPYDRLDQDVEMMKKAGINTVRIAESIWSTCEPQEGVFDFFHVIRVMDAMEQAGINVIIGTPTYAVPTWMVKAHPDVIATTKNGQGIYGARQIMDITNPVYLFYAERVIRELMKVTAHRKCVIGFQIDKVIVVPALYSAPDETLERLKEYVKNGGSLVATFKSGFADENIKVRTETQPGIIGEALGISYDQFTFPKNVKLEGMILENEENQEAEVFMELLRAGKATVLANYQHDMWGEYCAITENAYGKGMGYYIGCKTGAKVLQNVLKRVLNQAQVEIPKEQFPVIVCKGINEMGKEIRYFLNYSGEAVEVELGLDGMDLLENKKITSNETLTIAPWDVKVIESMQKNRWSSRELLDLVHLRTPDTSVFYHLYPAFFVLAGKT